MLESSSEFLAIVHTVTEIARTEQDTPLFDLLINSQVSIEQTHYDNWNGGTYGYTIYLSTDVKTFVGIKDSLEQIERLLLDRFLLATRHLENESINYITIIPRSYFVNAPTPDPHRPFSSSEKKRREELTNYLNGASEDELISEILLPLFRQLGFHRITFTDHKDKALEYGKDIWMKFMLPTQHVLYFGIQVKKGKLDSSGATKAGNSNIAEIQNQALMMLGHEIFDAEIGKNVLVDHAFIVAGGEITNAAKNWLGAKLDVSKRSQILFMDRNDILNLFVVTNLPLPSAAISKSAPLDDLPF